MTTITTTEPIVDVIFSVFRVGGDVIALMPYEQGTPEPGSCVCYQHIGQHGDADYTTVMRMTRPATPAEYDSLKRELERAPYHYNFRVKVRR